MHTVYAIHTLTCFNNTRIVEQLGKTTLVVGSDYQPFLHTYIHRIHLITTRIVRPYPHQVETLNNWYIHTDYSHTVCMDERRKVMIYVHAYIYI